MECFICDDVSEIAGIKVGNRWIHERCLDDFKMALNSKKEPPVMQAEEYVLICGSLSDGIRGVHGPFVTESDAEKYSERYNLGHYEKIIEKVMRPINRKVRYD